MFCLPADEGGAEHKLFSTAVVNIIVTDVNDNAPRFLDTSYEFELNRLNATMIGRVTAIDDDLGPGGNVKYRLVEQTEVRGAMKFTKVSLDYQNCPRSLASPLRKFFPILLRCHFGIKILDISEEFTRMSL